VKRSDPVHVIIRRKRLAMKIRDLLYGYTARPLKPRRKVVHWANVIAYWPARQILTYAEVGLVGEALAQMLGPDQPYGTPGEYDEEIDDKLRRALTGMLYKRAMEKKAGISHAEKSRLLDLVPQKRQTAWAKEALLNGACPMCLRDVSEGDQCGHGYGRPVIDGRGGILVD
jgi:hypothetical protein